MGGVVIMGRKTWESIPAKFRPLSGRTNIVITSKPQIADQEKDNSIIMASSLQDALAKINNTNQRVFVIGGAQLYATALQSSLARHIILTEIYSDLECDAFFEFPWSAGEISTDGQWRRASHTDLVSFTGLPDISEDNEENGLKYRFTLWNKASSS